MGAGAEDEEGGGATDVEVEDEAAALEEEEDDGGMTMDCAVAVSTGSSLPSFRKEVSELASSSKASWW